MKDALKLMRIPFSVYLMPVFWFAVSAVTEINWPRTVAVFLIIHVLVYPASNGYNSYFDKDEGSIGGLKNPPKVTAHLFRLVVLFDVLAVLTATVINVYFGACILVYLLVSKAYSYDKIRLKKYPLISTVVVILFQGAFTYLMVQVGLGLTSAEINNVYNLSLAGVSSLFLCGSYPITQIYQHQEDARRGDKTLSLLLGIRGTLVFAAFSLLLAAGILIFTYYQIDQLWRIIFFLACTAPVVFFFTSWFIKIEKNQAEANFENTMRMNKTSSVCLSAAFLLMIFTS